MESLVHPLDARRADARVEIAIARAEFEAQAVIRSTAALYLAVHDVLAEAREFPETFVPLAIAAGRDGREFAVRAAVLDLAVRTSLSEHTVRAYDHAVSTLLPRAPRVWALFRQGGVSVANVRVVTDIISTLPQQVWAAFEDAALTAAGLVPARFKARMRAARERLLPDASARHQDALKDRRVWLERGIDGMSEMGVHAAATGCERAMANVDRLARELATHPAESRTLAQLRADVAIDLLAGTLGAGTGVGITVGLTISVMTMLGHSDEPALLEGYGPIDAVTARELAGDAIEFYRILTHPVSGAIIDVDCPGYRPTTRLDRGVRVRDETCTTPGCGKPAVRCDLDHTIPWPTGRTNYANLKAVCRDHHRVKHNTLWQTEQDANGNTTWTSPTGYARAPDPPPL